MSDLIDRQAAIDEIYHHFPSLSHEEAAMVLHTVPSADVVEVVRCKDCKHFATINEPYNETFCRLCFMNKSKKGYCDKAERRTDGQIH